MTDREEDKGRTWSSVQTRDSGRIVKPAGGARIPCLTLCCHADLRRVGQYALLPELADGRAVEVSRITPLFVSQPGDDGGPLDDPFVSRKPVLLEPTVWGVRLKVPPGSTALKANGAPVAGSLELSWEQLDAGVVLELSGRVVLMLNRREQPPSLERRLGLIGRSERMERVRADIQALAGRELPTLLQGETGTGKELVARAIHQLSPRADRPFVSVNMAAIPVATAISQLFGHAKGAFTGAVGDHPGFFGQADGGTIFLDEVGDMPTDVQVSLLRVLETGEVQPVGARSTRIVNVRLLSATDSDLVTAMAQDRFRGSLLHRLCVFQIDLPALRHRREDIPRLLVHFLRAELEADGDVSRLQGSPAEEHPWLPSSVVAHLMLHSWPGNVRQLRNIARQLAMHTDRPVDLEPGSPLARLVSQRSPRQPARTESQQAIVAVDTPPPLRPADLDEPTLLAALGNNDFNVGATARELGISRTSLYALMKRYPGIRKAGDLTADEILAAVDQLGDDLKTLAQHLKVSQQGLARRMRDLELTRPTG